MSNRILNDVILYKCSLDKSLESNASEDEVLDILEALKKVPISVELLRETGIGKSVNNVKKKFTSGNGAHKEARELVEKWKRDCDILNSGAKTKDTKPKHVEERTESVTKEAANTRIGTSETIKLAAISTDDGDADEHQKAFEDSYNSLTSNRRKVRHNSQGDASMELLQIMDVLTEHLKLSATAPNIAKFLAYNIEGSINEMHSSFGDNKAYLSKARTLIFNLKNNERLRQEIVSGSLSAEELVRLSPDELATDDVRSARDRDLKSGTMERRADYYEAVAKEKIQKANGIDPSIGGEFTCRKCKNNKTTHYAMQTRSADEPMTVFVGCLTCGNRWRQT